MGDRLILALDGSTRVCGAALLRPRPVGAGGRPGGGAWDVMARRTDVDGRSQAKVLLSLIDEMLEELGSTPQELGAIVVGTGPGTFTGVRITVATGRALSLALGRPVVGVSTLGALAAGGAALAAGGAMPAPGVAQGTEPAGVAGAATQVVRPASDMGPPYLIVPVIDARRAQVFYGLYEAAVGVGAGAAGEERAERRYARSAPFGVCDKETLAAVVSEAEAGADRRVLVVAEERALVGDLPPRTAFAAAEVEPERLVTGQEWLDEAGEGPQGWRLTPWLLERLGGPGQAPPGSAGPALGRAGEVGTPEAVRPIYVRSPDADIHITKMKDPWAATSSGRRAGPGGGAGRP